MNSDINNRQELFEMYMSMIFAIANSDPSISSAISINSSNVDAESTIEEIAATSYEVIDIEDPNRTIFIANFEIDGNKFRGLKRKVTSLFKNNKSDRNK